MNKSKETTYIDYLASSSEALLNHLESEKFIEWAINTLFEHLKPSHVSVALFDQKNDAFLIKHSVGTKCFPAKLIQIQKTSAIVKWFSRRVFEQFPLVFMASKRPMPKAFFSEVSAELKRHLSAVCAQIKSQHNLGGYLLVGESQTLGTYAEKDQAYFQTIANNIAVEIEKQHYYQRAHFDQLTQLFNRQSLSSKLEACINMTKETGVIFALCMLDLDDFKKINDTYGHLAGDEVLRVVAQILQKGIRGSDFAFRYGGEEFLVILGRRSRISSKPQTNESFQRFAFKVMNRLRFKLASRSIKISQGSLHITASIGMSFSKEGHFKSAHQLIEEADRAVYMSKQAGKNKVIACGFKVQRDA